MKRLKWTLAIAYILIGIGMLTLACSGLTHAHKDGAENCWRCKQLQSEGRAP